MAGTQGKYEKTTSAKDKCKTNKALRTMRKCYMNYCWIWKKTSKYCGHTGWLQRHKECKWKLKINKVLRTTAKMIHELVPHTSKSHQNIVGTQANYESTKYSDEKSKSNKVLRTTAKLMHELLPDRKKVMETLPGTQNDTTSPRAIRLKPPACMKSFPNAAQVVNSISWFQPTEVPRLPRLEKECKSSSGRARLRRRQDSLHMPDTICFWFEFIWHPTASLLLSKGMKSVSSVKNLTTHRFIRMTYWGFNHPNRPVCSTSGALVQDMLKGFKKIYV